MSTALKLRERAISAYLRYSHHVTSSIVACRGLEYMSTMRLAGRSWKGFTGEELRGWNDAVHNALRGQRFGAIGYYTHIVRRRIDEYPHSTYRQPFAQRFDAHYHRQFEGHGLMLNELYLTVLVRPESDPVLAKLARIEKASSAQLEAWQADLQARLEAAMRALEVVLAPYDPELLQIVERNGTAFSEPKEFLGLILNGTHTPMPVTRGKIADSLPVSRPIFSQWGELGELRSLEGTRTFGILEARDLPEKLRPGQIDSLLSAPFEFVVAQSWGSFGKADAIKMAERQQRLLRDSGDHSASQIAELSWALDDIAAGRIGMGDHHMTVQVFGEDAGSTLAAMSKVAGLLSDADIDARAVDSALEAGFWSQMPGNWSWRPRPEPLASDAFLDLNSFHNELSGKPVGNPWGPAVAMFRTETGAPFFFNYHVSLEEVDETGKRRPGNTAFIGQTGTGKTVIQAALLTFAMKFEASAVVYDKDRGLQVTIMALGGRYFVLRLGESTGWAPLQLSKTPRNLAFMHRFIEHLAGVRGEPVTTEDMRDISTAIKGLMAMDRADRRISNLITMLPQESARGATSVHHRLLPWCEGGEYGWMFDGHNDTLDLGDESSSDQILLGFDLTELLEDPIARSSATLLLEHRVNTLTNGRRIIKLVDECQHPLSDEHFAGSMQDDSRTIRKKNGVLAYSTQEPAALLALEAGRSMLAQAATLCFLPNPDAKWAEYEQMGVTRSVFELIKGLSPNSRKMVVKQNSNVTVVDIGLPGCEDELLVFSGSEDMAILAEGAIEEVGPDPEAWLPLFLERARAALRSS